jgi:histidinol-phosphate aminotransferase
VGLLDYYRQFEGLSEEEVNAQLRTEAAERKSRQLARREIIDLGQTTWPRLPGPDVVAAITYAARRGLHSYSPPDRDALRSELAHRHGVGPDRVAVGHGAAALLQALVGTLVDPGREIVCPWPSFALFPEIAVRARAELVAARRLSAEALLAAVTSDTRLVLLARPNDPTGELLPLAELQRVLEALPETAALVLDEALVDYIDAEPVDATVALLEHHPRLLLVRSFSKAWGLAGLRCGYVIGGPGSEPLLRRVEPTLGIGDLAIAGVLESMRDGGELVRRRAGAVAVQRGRLSAALRNAGFELPDSQANFLWVSHPHIAGADLVAGLHDRGIVVAPGRLLTGEPGAMRIQVRDEQASERLLEALLGLV